MLKPITHKKIASKKSSFLKSFGKLNAKILVKLNDFTKSQRGK